MPRVSYTKSLFREFMSRLTSRGLLRRVPFRHIKIVFFNLLTAIGASTGKSLSEALIFASTNPQYDDRLFIELEVQYMKIPSSSLGRTKEYKSI